MDQGTFFVGEGEVGDHVCMIPVTLHAVILSIGIDKSSIMHSMKERQNCQHAPMG